MGGLALNCVANTQDRAGRCLRQDLDHAEPRRRGVVARRGGGFRTRTSIGVHPYLGENIDRPFPHADVVAALLNGEVVGIANGRAEFGPRASVTGPSWPIRADRETKDRVNRIKKREPFRPFAPVIMAEFADAYFDMPVPESPYMQFVAPVKRPDLFPAIAHFDNTARVQTVSPSADIPCSTISCHASTKRPAVRCS